MSAPVSCLDELPTETLEQIFLYLPGQDTMKMELVCRRFRDLTRDSPTLRNKRGLFSAGLIENPLNSCDFDQRQKVLEEHERKWSNAGRVVRAVHGLPEGLSLGRYFTTIIGRNVIAFRSRHDSSLSLLRIPPVTSGEPIDQWSIPPPHFNPKAFAAYPPDGILAVAEGKERFVCIHFLNLSDGSPYGPSNTIAWEFPTATDVVSVQKLAVTSSRVMMSVCCCVSARRHGQKAWGVFVWDWKNGDLVLELPPTDRSIVVQHNTTATFLDEFRMIVFTPPNAPDIPEFALFDTLIPHGHPVNSRRFRVPLRYHGWFPRVHFDGDRCLGTLDRDIPLTTDPTHAILIVQLVSRDPQLARVFLVVRIQTLIEHVSSMDADAYVPWDDWGRDAWVMEVPQYGIGSSLYPLIQGAHVALVKTCITPAGYRPHLCIFDFSLRGRSILSPWGEDEEAERRVLFEGGWNFLLEGNEEMAEYKFESLGDGKFMYLEQFSGVESGDLLQVWELI